MKQCNVVMLVISVVKNKTELVILSESVLLRESL